MGFFIVPIEAFSKIKLYFLPQKPYNPDRFLIIFTHSLPPVQGTITF
jgi:hypothetical protein